MNEDFVSFELAVKLKKKRFDKPCFAYYTNDDTLYLNHSWKAGENYSGCLLSHNLMHKDSVSGKFVDAPTISQVLKWLREEKKIHIVIDFDGGMCWYYQIALYGLTTYEKESEHKYNSYEQAALAGIEYVLDNLV